MGGEEKKVKASFLRPSLHIPHIQQHFLFKAHRRVVEKISEGFISSALTSTNPHFSNNTILSTSRRSDR